MRHFFPLLLALVFNFVAATASAGGDFTEILSTTSADALKTVVRRSVSAQRRARGCEIQHRAGVPPTLCYPAKNAAEIDSECARATRAAVRLPSTDEFTSPACRDAIEKRGKDLAYATGRDASR